MATLVQPTAQNIVGFYPAELGTSQTVGTLDADAITGYIAANPAYNVVTLTTSYIRSLLSDPDNLNATDFPNAYNALIWACIYELLSFDLANRECVPDEQGGGIQATTYHAKLWQAASYVGQYLLAVGVSNSKYWRHDTASVELINDCNHAIRWQNF